MPFDPKKPCKTRDGREVRIYATDGQEPYVLHGAVKDYDGGWLMTRWRDDGCNDRLGSQNLVNIPETVYVNVFKAGNGSIFGTVHAFKDDAIYSRTNITFIGGCLAVAIPVELPASK